MDTECLRARHSECIDLASVQLRRQLMDSGIPFTEAEIAALPARFVELLVSRLEMFRQREVETRAAVDKCRRETEVEEMRFEQLREATERVQGEKRIISSKISAAVSEYMREDKLEKEKQRERHNELQEVFRQVEKKEAEHRREIIEMERLRKMLKKVTK
ncbi:uncharacterized protein TEOVI_000874800 [Trypanosoma equiperdum]|uniref:Uncharacterized protein n=1 Tax=Trypanosoma equiperdum TaxID=5694 RepID=A0A1G4I7Z1_TRYEQ|nr:hypothetical protein, conserved [Trypanosoma equiperdum]